MCPKLSKYDDGKLISDFIYLVMSDKNKFVRHILFNFYNDGRDGRS